MTDNIDKAIEVKHKHEVLFSMEKKFKTISKNMFYNKNNMNLENKKLEILASKFEKSLDLIFKDKKELKSKITDLYTKDNKIDYKKLSETMTNLEEKPKSFIKITNSNEPILKALKAQNINNDVKHTLDERSKHAIDYYSNRDELSNQSNKNFKTAKNYGLLDEFNAYIKSNDKYNTRLVGDYNRAIKDIQTFKKSDPKAFELKIKDKGLDESITQKHKIIENIAKTKFKKQSVSRSK